MKEKTSNRKSFFKNIFFGFITLNLLFFTLSIVTLDLDLAHAEEQPIYGVSKFTPEKLKQIEAIPELELTSQSSLPTSTDNSIHKYMPPIFRQKGGSCTVASSIGYVFTYEMNRSENSDGSSLENQYHEAFIYGFLDTGPNSGTRSIFNALNTAMVIGTPSADVYSRTNTSLGQWANGYDIYYNAMHHRVDSYFTIDVSTEEGLNTLKQWLHNHGDGSTYGGLAAFSTVFGYDATRILDGSNAKAGQSILLPWDSKNNSGLHAMTIVGYDDTVKFDYNGDGKYTNDVDLNGDDKKDMADWEIGAFKIANSHGTQWPYNQTSKNDPGYAYFSYRNCTLKLKQWDNMNSIAGSKVYVLKPKIGYRPVYTAKVSITHPCRERISLYCRHESKSYAPIKPTLTGCVPMQGKNRSATIEMGFDYSHFANIREGTSSFSIHTYNSEYDGEGFLNSFSIIDDYSFKKFELESPDKDIPINNVITSDAAYATVDYHRLSSQEMLSDFTVEGKMQMGFKSTISYDRDLTLAINAQLEIYNSFNVDNGSDITMYNGSKIIGKDPKAEINLKGNLIIHGDVTIENCKLILNNNIIAGSNASLTIKGSGKSDTLLEVSKQILFSGAFKSVKIENGKIIMNNSSSKLYMNNKISSLTLNNLLVTSSSGSRNNHKGIDIRCDNFSVANSTFQHGYYGLYISRSMYASGKTISSSTFYNNYYGLTLSAGTYNVHKSHFSNNSYGISAYLSYGAVTISNATLKNGNYGMYLHGSLTGGFNISNSEISACSSYGIYATNKSFIRLKCTVIHSNHTGIYVTDNSKLYMSNASSENSGMNTIHENNYGILGGADGSTANYIELNNGYNLIANSHSKNLSGHFQSVPSGYYTCNYNYWRNGGGSPRSGYEYGTLYGTGGRIIYLRDNYPLSTFSACGNIGATNCTPANAQTEQLLYSFDLFRDHMLHL